METVLAPPVRWSEPDAHARWLGRGGGTGGPAAPLGLDGPAIPAHGAPVRDSLCLGRKWRLRGTTGLA